jgi:hypothetical protein
MKVVKGYKPKPEEVARFPKMLACLTLSLEEGMSDCLGQLFMALVLGNGRAGQFFTPYHVSVLMAKMLRRCWPAMQGAGICARDGTGSRGKGYGDRHCGSLRGGRH